MKKYLIGLALAASPFICTASATDGFYNYSPNELIAKLYLNCANEFSLAMDGNLNKANEVGAIIHTKTETGYQTYTEKYVLDTVFVRYYSITNPSFTHVAQLIMTIHGRPAYIPGLLPVETAECVVQYVNEPYDWYNKVN